MAVYGCKRYRISDSILYLIATAVCGYKGCRISVCLITTTVCGYKGYQISVYLKATAICDYKGYWISIYLTVYSRVVCGCKGYRISAYLIAKPRQFVATKDNRFWYGHEQAHISRPKSCHMLMKMLWSY
jgi:hypothetical protein